ncbi:MAG: glycosyltransferase [Solirubrobacterales bacterium]|nr:glycosyltransferase [Solirubrobacterales bacterium]
MRVVFLSHASRLSGAEIGLLRFVQATHGVVSSHVVLAEDGDLVGALRDAGARVDVLALEEGTRSLRRSELALGRRQFAAGGALGRYILALRALLRDVRPDLVHTVSLKAGVYGSTAARLGGVPVVWHLHDHLTAGYLPARAVAPMRALAGWWPSGLLVPSRSVLATVGRRRSGLLTDVLPFPVPLPEAAVEPREEVAVVGMLGRITPWKGQDVFLEAFAQAFPAGDVHARIIGNALFGESDYEHELHAQAARLGIADRVEFTGFRTDVDAELRRLDVLVHASVLPDPLPGVVLEGMGMGLPVVAADAGGQSRARRRRRQRAAARAGGCGRPGPGAATRRGPAYRPCGAGAGGAGVGAPVRARDRRRADPGVLRGGAAGRGEEAAAIMTRRSHDGPPGVARDALRMLTRRILQ